VTLRTPGCPMMKYVWVASGLSISSTFGSLPRTGGRSSVHAYAVPAGYRSAWGYWGTGWTGAYDPGHYRQDQVVYVESNVYSLTDDKLIWSARTKTYNPDNVPKMVDEIVDGSIAEMKKQGIVTATQPSQ